MRLRTAASALVVAALVSIGTTSPAHADQVGVLNCTASTSHGSTTCTYPAAPNLTAYLYIYVGSTGYGGASVSCDGVTWASISGTAGGHSVSGWTNPGGVCILTAYNYSGSIYAYAT